MRKTAVLAFGVGALLMSEPAQPSPPNRSLDEVRALFKEAGARGLVGKARKTKLVDARPAKPGEVIVTVIAGEGKETESKPAAKGDWVVRNRCEATGHEQYLVAAAIFKERYQGAGKATPSKGSFGSLPGPGTGSSSAPESVWMPAAPSFPPGRTNQAGSGNGRSSE